MDESLKNKTVIVTGAAGDIGNACARAFLAAGANVVLADIAPIQLNSDACRYIPTDVASEDSIKNLIDATLAAFSGIDILVNNAAVIPPMTKVHETQAVDFDKLIAVNLRGPFLCSKYAYPHLRKTRGCIVNVSSMSGVCGEAGHAAYSASKGGLNGLTKAMAIDYGPDGIRCNAVCPSSVLTAATDKLINAAPDPQKVVAYRKRINLLGYTATPEQIASVVLFLCSPAAGFMTGAIVPVSGGSEIGYGVKFGVFEEGDVEHRF